VSVEFEPAYPYYRLENFRENKIKFSILHRRLQGFAVCWCYRPKEWVTITRSSCSLSLQSRVAANSTERVESHISIVSGAHRGPVDAGRTPCVSVFVRIITFERNDLW